MNVELNKRTSKCGGMESWTPSSCGDTYNSNLKDNECSGGVMAARVVDSIFSHLARWQSGSTRPWRNLLFLIGGDFNCRFLNAQQTKLIDNDFSFYFLNFDT